MQVQKAFLSQFRKSKDSDFVRVMYKRLKDAAARRKLQAKEKLAMGEATADDDPTMVRVNVLPELRLLQLLCEGHYTKIQV